MSKCLTPLDRERLNRLLDPLTLINVDRQHGSVITLTFRGNPADITELSLQLGRWMMEEPLFIPIREAKI